MDTIILEQAIYSGIQFLISIQNEDKGISGAFAGNGASSCWLAAEVIEFINDACFLPQEVYKIKHDLINFLLSNQTEAGYWPMVVSSTPNPSAITTGHSIYALKKSLNFLTITSEREEILDAITRGENWLLKNQEEDGFWLEGGKIEANEKNIRERPALSEKLVCTYYAYLGVKCEKVYSYQNRDDLRRAEQKCINFFAKAAESLINNEGKTSNFADIWLSAVSRTFLVLSPYYNDYKILCDKLYDILLKRKEDFHSATMVRLSSVSVDGNKAVTNNTPFDCYFALMAKAVDIELLDELIDYFVKTQDNISKCWYLNGDPESGVNTWTTCEALMVLAKAYKEYQEIYLKVREQEILKRENRVEKEEQNVTTLKKNLDKQILQQVNQQADYTKAEYDKQFEKLKQYNNKIFKKTVAYAIISVLTSIGCILLLVLYSYCLKKPILKSVLNLFIIPLTVNIFYTFITAIVNIKKNIFKEREDTK